MDTTRDDGKGPENMADLKSLSNYKFFTTELGYKLKVFYELYIIAHVGWLFEE